MTLSADKSASPRLTFGAEVCTADNSRVGIVGEQHGEHFMVQPRLGRGFWLSDVLIRRQDSTEARVVLNVSRDVLRLYKLRRTEEGFEQAVCRPLLSRRGRWRVALLRSHMEGRGEQMP